LFTVKGILFFMNTLYHKIAIASVCTALSFTLGANQEAKAATFTLTATEFFVDDIAPNGYPTDGLGDVLLNSRYEKEFIFSTFFDSKAKFPSAARTSNHERRGLYEFNIGNLSLANNTVIRSAIFQTSIQEFQATYRFLILDIFGYVGNGKPDVSDFQAGVRLTSDSAITPYPFSIPRPIINFDVTSFVNQRVSSGDAFAGFGIGINIHPFAGVPSQFLNSFPHYGSVTVQGTTNSTPSLIIETVDVAEPVPEPTTIFGSALALGVGGWLKRKNPSRANKTTLQR
jgi:hypothetical protein